jgi:hypothetical protein
VSWEHGVVAKALREGVLYRMPCEICGEIKVHAHHDDSSDPLAVKWLCPTHHRQLHARLTQRRKMTGKVTVTLRLYQETKDLLQEQLLKREHHL